MEEEISWQIILLTNLANVITKSTSLSIRMVIDLCKTFFVPSLFLFPLLQILHQFLYIRCYGLVDPPLVCGYTIDTYMEHRISQYTMETNGREWCYVPQAIVVVDGLICLWSMMSHLFPSVQCVIFATLFVTLTCPSLWIA